MGSDYIVDVPGRLYTVVVNKKNDWMTGTYIDVILYAIVEIVRAGRFNGKPTDLALSGSDAKSHK